MRHETNDRLIGIDRLTAERPDAKKSADRNDEDDGDGPADRSTAS
jgi:hypothetical protein